MHFKINFNENESEFFVSIMDAINYNLSMRNTVVDMPAVTNITDNNYGKRSFACLKCVTNY